MIEPPTGRIARLRLAGGNASRTSCCLSRNRETKVGPPNRLPGRIEMLVLERLRTTERHVPPEKILPLEQVV
jgi:hypothetical protein